MIVSPYWAVRAMHIGGGYLRLYDPECPEYFECGAGLFASLGDGTSAGHSLLGEPPDMAWITLVDRVTPQIKVAPDPGARAGVPDSWAKADRKTLYLFQPHAVTIAKPVCECGVDKTGVGGLHSDWCPKHV